MDQKEAMVKRAPAGLAEVFGLSNLTNLGPKLTDAKAAPAPAPMRRIETAPGSDESALKKWRWPVLGVVAVGLIYFLVKRDSGETQSLMINRDPAPASTAATVTLPGGRVLSLKEGSLDYNVAKFLGDLTDMAVPKTFVFDRVPFDPNSTHLTPESVQTVEGLLVILKAYPATDVRVDGHTDNVGSVEDNQKLSLDRATAVQEVLIKGGISATRVTTAGYGRETPVASKDPEDGRVQSLELVVVKK